MEGLVDSDHDSEIGDSDSIYTCSTSSSSFTEFESEANEADEIAVDQLSLKQVRTRGGLTFQSTRNPNLSSTSNPSIDPQKDQLIDALGHPGMNPQNTLPIASISIANSPTSANRRRKIQPYRRRLT